MSTADKIRCQLQEVGNLMLANELAWGNAGNISARVNPNQYLITASGTQLGALEMDDLLLCPVNKQASGNEQRKPSKEAPMHRAVYQTRPDVDAVLHASPFYGTLVACSDLELPNNWFVEDMYYLERVGRVRYEHPGSQALAAAVREQATQANVLLLQNHGVLVYDSSIREALMALQTLEFVCRMAVTMQSATIAPQELSQNIVDDFLNNAGYRPRKQWPTKL